MRQMYCILIGLALLSSAGFAQEQKNIPVRVYVFAKPVTGFVDEARPIEDSVKDLREKFGETFNNGRNFKKHIEPRFPNLVVVDKADDADITLEVVSSGKVAATPQIETRNTLFGGKISTVKERVLPKIVTLLQIKGSEYTKEFSVQDNADWRYLADDIAKQIDKWVKANRTQLQH